jgi:hypothetical protein
MADKGFQAMKGGVDLSAPSHSADKAALIPASQSQAIKDRSTTLGHFYKLSSRGALYSL